MVHSVSQQYASRISHRATKTVKIFVGRGRMISGTSKTTQASSQTISRMVVASHGMAMRGRVGAGVGSSGVLLGDALAQLVHDLDEMRLERRRQRARPRDVDLPARRCGPAGGS